MSEPGRPGVGWDPWSEVDRRWGEARAASVPVPLDRRSGDDRRRKTGRVVIGDTADAVATGDDAHWLDRAFSPTTTEIAQDEAATIVTVRMGFAGSVYAAWELATEVEEDRAIYRVIRDDIYRQIGSRTLSTSKAGGEESPTEEELGEFERAYAAIYREYPSLRSLGTERLGVVVVTD